MELDRGNKLGSYEILDPINAGVNGEVYRALDTLLGREVTIKLLPTRLLANAEQWRRVEQDVRILSRLHHPHICTVYDVRHFNNFRFVVTESLEGETLASRLSRETLTNEELLTFAIQIAEGLDEAHREGVIHQHLTPANVILTPDGAKLFDFSIAEDTDPVENHPLASPMLEEARTSGAGDRSLRYTSPEQLNGKQADARSDIFSFGTLLYEMVTGRPAFPGESPVRVAAAIRERDPSPISLVQPAAPPLDSVVRACMAKNPEDRFQSAHDLKLQLEWVRDGLAEEATASTTRSRNRERVAWLVAAGAVVVATALVVAALLHHMAATGPPRIHAEINLPAGLALGRSDDSLALSPKGSQLVVAATDTAGERQLWLRGTDSSVFHALAGTVGATFPFWSPEGDSIGFFAGGQLKRINLATNAVFTICAAPDGRGATWNRAGTIVFAPLPFGGLYRVSADGGTPVQVSVPPRASMTQRLPHFLPGGRRLLFYSGVPGSARMNGIHVLDLASGKFALLVHAASEGRYVAPGYLAFVRDRDLMVQHFHTSRLALTGHPIPIVRGVAFNSRTATGEYAFSPDGLLVYESAAPPPASRLSWFSLEGKKLATVGKPQPFVSATVSPDGHEAIAQTDDGTGGFSLWIYDLENGRRHRFNPATASFSTPIWSPDGRKIAYRDSRDNLFLKFSSDSIPPRKIFSPKDPWGLSSWSPDGRVLALDVLGSGGWNIWMLPIGARQEPRPFLQTAYNTYDCTFSSSGRWISYVSDASGRSELYVDSYRHPGKPRQVSAGGVLFGGWVPGVPKLAYVTPQGRLMIVKTRTIGHALQLGKPRVAMGGHPLPVSNLSPGPLQNPVNFFSPSGKRVLLPVPIEPTHSKLTLLTDWKARMPKE